MSAPWFCSTGQGTNFINVNKNQWRRNYARKLQKKKNMWVLCRPHQRKKNYAASSKPRHSARHKYVHSASPNGVQHLSLPKVRTRFLRKFCPCTLGMSQSTSLSSHDHLGPIATGVLRHRGQLSRFRPIQLLVRASFRICQTDTQTTPQGKAASRPCAVTRIVFQALYIGLRIPNLLGSFRDLNSFFNQTLFSLSWNAVL